MREFILSTENACDLTKTQIEDMNVSVMPMNFYIDGEEFSSSTSTLSTIDICNKMEAGAITRTSQPNETEIEEYLKALLNSGKDILHLSFSSGMSGTCERFKFVANKLNETHENKIYVVDTLCQSSGVGLLISILNQKINDANLTITEAVELAESLKLSIVHFFMVDDLKYLARGGRIPKSIALIGNLIKLKPVLHVDNTGKIVQAQKVIGKKKAFHTIIEKFKKYYNGQSNKVFISEAKAIEDAEELKSELLKINPNLDITINPLGPIIVSHSGPGTLALYFTAYTRNA